MISREEVTLALIAAIELGTGKPVGDHVAPENADGTTKDHPYSILEVTSGGARWGPAWFDPEADADFEFMISSVGSTPRQALWLADRVREVMIGRNSEGQFIHTLAMPAGVRIMDRRSGPLVHGAVEREISSYVVPDTYTIALTSE